MIDTMDARAIPAGFAEAGRTLLERMGRGMAGARAEVPGTESPREWVETLAARLPAAAAWTVLEHLFGVLPLVAAFFAREAITEPLEELIAALWGGHRLGALGLFTPTPELRWCAAALDGEPSASGVVLRGEVRIPSPAADGSLVLVRLAGEEHRLAWLDHTARGVERRGSRMGGAVSADAPCWLAVDGAVVGRDLLSSPVALDPGAELHRLLAGYAGVWALAAAICARDGVRALRRAARTTEHRGVAFRTSQLVAMGITAVEIEAELTVAAAERADAQGSRGLVLATAAARTLSSLAAQAAELRDLAGVAGDGAARVLTAFLGGPLMLENELDLTSETAGAL